jgi:hypothetical protein
MISPDGRALRCETLRWNTPRCGSDIFLYLGIRRNSKNDTLFWSSLGLKPLVMY